jgi:DNA polymerase
MADTVVERAGKELATVTGGAVATPNALIPLKQWLASNGCPVDSLDKESVTALLAGQWPPKVRRALELRQEAGKASVAKLNKMQELVGEDGRLRHWGQYHGAGTGRWAARGVQVHNLVRDMPPPHVVEEVLAAVRNNEIEWLDMAYGSPMTMISRCLRSFFRAAPGKMLCVGDFTAVEGRGVAWVSGEEWKLRAFRDADAKRGPGIYELTASKTLGIPVESIAKDSPERFMGKTQELAFGYQGGVGAARKFLPAHLAHLPDSTLNQWKLAWRVNHPRTKAMWYALQEAAIDATRTAGTAFACGPEGRRVTFKRVGSFLWCRLPSGRVLCYPYPKLLADEYGDRLTYMTVPNDLDAKSGRIIHDDKNANNWARIGTYGGALMENVVQALCRDLMVDCMFEMDAEGLPIVLHVHDEIVLEVESANAAAAVARMQQIMRAAPPWAKDFPLWAECKIMQRYGK